MQIIRLLLLSVATTSVKAFDYVHCGSKLPAVAFRAVSPLLPSKEMAKILSGERSMERVSAEAYRIDRMEGRSAARKFLDRIPLMYMWKCNQLQNIIVHNSQIQQVVVLDAHMCTLAYDLPCLRKCHVVEIADRTLVQVKEDLIARKASHVPLLAKSITRTFSIQEVDWKIPTIAVMSNGYIPLNELSNGSAIVCNTDYGGPVPDTRTFQSVTVNKVDTVLQIAASRLYKCNL
jgi:hypothetical protein